jgi:hypothetical protein
VGLFQAARQRVSTSRHGNKMDVIGHQAVADQLHPVPLDALLQQIKVDTALRVVFQNEAPRIPALRYVMRNV